MRDGIMDGEHPDWDKFLNVLRTIGFKEEVLDKDIRDKCKHDKYFRRTKFALKMFTEVHIHKSIKEIIKVARCDCEVLIGAKDKKTLDFKVNVGFESGDERISEPHYTYQWHTINSITSSS